jgi:putative ABC transport system ATP-binding protein
MSEPTSQAAGNTPVLEVMGLSKTYHTPGGDVPVLKDVNLTVNSGEIVAVMGPSGSGKSSLLFILGLFQNPTSGSFRLNGKSPQNLDRSGQAKFRRHMVGFVFQSCDLMDNCSVYENLEYPLMYDRVSFSQRRGRIEKALEQVNLSHRLNYRANLLSGGERQRVAVARALVNNPPFILADEPTGQLDSDNSQQVMEMFKNIVTGTGKAILLVSHDPEVARQCNRLCTLRDGVLHED